MLVIKGKKIQKKLKCPILEGWFTILWLLSTREYSALIKKSLSPEMCRRKHGENVQYGEQQTIKQQIPHVCDFKSSVCLQKTKCTHASCRANVMHYRCLLRRKIIFAVAYYLFNNNDASNKIFNTGRDSCAEEMKSQRLLHDVAELWFLGPGSHKNHKHHSCAE